MFVMYLQFKLHPLPWKHKNVLAIAIESVLSLHYNKFKVMLVGWPGNIIWYNIESIHPKDNTDQIWFKSNKWFQRRGKNQKLKYTDGRTSDGNSSHAVTCLIVTVCRNKSANSTSIVIWMNIKKYCIVN